MHNQDSCDCIRSLSIKLYSIYPFIGTIASLWSPSTATIFLGFSTISGDNIHILAFFRLVSFLLNRLPEIQSVLIVKKIELSNIKFNVATRISDVNQRTERDGKRLYIWILQSAFISSDKIQHLPIRPAKPSLP